MTDDWLDMLKELTSAGARYLVVGAHALAVHGIPRGTQDLDIWIERSDDNAERVWQALRRFGAPVDATPLHRNDLVQQDLVVQLGLPPNRIDLMTSLSGLPDFPAAWGRRIEGSVRDQVFPVLGRADLIANKRAAARPKDLADVSALEGSSMPER